MSEVRPEKWWRTDVGVWWRAHVKQHPVYQTLEAIVLVPVAILWPALVIYQLSQWMKTGVWPTLTILDVVDSGSNVPLWLGSIPLSPLVCALSVFMWLMVWAELSLVADKSVNQIPRHAQTFAAWLIWPFWILATGILVAFEVPTAIDRVREQPLAILLVLLCLFYAKRLSEISYQLHTLSVSLQKIPASSLHSLERQVRRTD